MLIFSGILLISSCKKDYLQRDTGVPIDYNKVFSDPRLAKGFGDNSYTFLLDDYTRLYSNTNGMTGQFADESIDNILISAIASMNSGQFQNTTASDVSPIYAEMYKGIRNTNVMLANMNAVPWTNTYDPAFIRGEQFFLRAFFYFELMKRFGGVVLLDKAQTIDEATADLPRAGYDETQKFILRDVDSAIAQLPVDWPSVATDYGRATKGAARALKSRTLLHAASPLNNPSNEAAKWKKAAQAARDVIDMGRYSLIPNYANILNQTNSDEYILIKILGGRAFTNGQITNFIAPPTYGGQQSLISVTQNHVDLYEMKNGKTITDPTSGYNPQSPYLNRDPRFYINVLANDQTWQGRKLETFTGGKDRVPGSTIYTQTGYYVKRLWPEVLKSGSTTTALVNFIFFRYAEVLLNYAEALNESDGPVADVYTYVNLVRSRAGMPALLDGLTKDQMRLHIRNERAVEFAFEEMRWWDILRWKEGISNVTQPMKGMVITKTGSTFSYNVVNLDPKYQRVFSDYMHVYPIPLAEINKSQSALTQNPGW